jgi:hypothetical protein
MLFLLTRFTLPLDHALGFELADRGAALAPTR